MVFPFMMGNIIITFFFRTENTNRIYFFDLAGATCGIFFSVVTIPLLKTENALLMCIALMSCVGFLFSKKKNKVLRAVFYIFFIICLAAMATNLQWHVLNLEKIARGGRTDRTKDFYSFRKKGLPFLFSRDNLVARVSVYTDYSDEKTRTYDGKLSTEFQWVCFDGDSNDSVNKLDLHVYRNDPRIPFMYFEDGIQYTLFDPPPRVFIIGTSAEGIVKSVKFLVKDVSLIDTVEINPAIVRMMQNELFELSGRAYENVDVKIMDARAYLEHSKEHYDIITMMNTYTVQNIAYFGEPDFIHTRDAIDEYFDHLNDRGFLLLEERDVSTRSRYAIFRLLNNIIYVLDKRGYKEPEKHFLIYNLNVDKAKYRWGWYTFIIVKKTPITASEREYFHRWIDSRNNIEYILKQEKSPDMDLTYIYHTQLEYLFGENIETDYSRFFQSEDRDAFWGKEVRLTTTSDDNPYIFDVFKNRKEIEQLLTILGGICAAILCVAAVIFAVTQRGKPFKSALPFISYFILLGLGYFIIEITLLKLYQCHTGSPTNSLVFVLGGLLLSSGIGSYFSRDYSSKKILWSFLGIVLFSSYHIFANRHLLHLMGVPVWAENLIITVTLFPLGFCMGIPFPFGIEKVKQTFTELHVPVFVAINSLASAFGIALGLYMSVALGFILTSILGVGCYAGALILFVFLVRSG